jgi:hypothetical protein
VTERTHDEPLAPDPTRDITLPPLPDRPLPVMPAAWAAAHPPVSPPATAVPAPAPPPVAAPEEPDPAVVEARRMAGQRTDELVQPPGAGLRDRTLAFSSPEMRHRPIEPVQVGANPRRWPWVVLTLVPVLVIVVSTVAWVILVQNG